MDNMMSKKDNYTHFKATNKNEMEHKMEQWKYNINIKVEERIEQ
jgi:hypothetical protein